MDFEQDLCSLRYKLQNAAYFFEGDDVKVQYNGSINPVSGKKKNHHTFVYF